MSEVIFLQNVRLSFPHLTEAHSANQDGSNPRFSADFLLAQNDPAWLAFHEQVNLIAQERWTTNAAAILQYINQDKRMRCYGDGSEKINKATMQPYDGYGGLVYISAHNQLMPQIIGTDGKQIDPANMMACQMEARKMYGGCYVNAAVKPWLQDNQHGRAVRGDLVAVQFARDGEPFGESAPDASGMFGAVATPAGAGAPIPQGTPAGGAMVPPGAGYQSPQMPMGNPPGAAPGAPQGMPPGAAPGASQGLPPGPAPQVGNATAAPVQGQDGNWYDPTTGVMVAPPVMPGYPGIS